MDNNIISATEKYFALKMKEAKKANSSTTPAPIEKELQSMNLEEVGEIDDWDAKYDAVKDIQGRTEFDYSKNGNVFGRAVEIAPKFLIIEDYILTEMEKNG